MLLILGAASSLSLTANSTNTRSTSCGACSCAGQVWLDEWLDGGMHAGLPEFTAGAADAGAEVTTEGYARCKAMK